MNGRLLREAFGFHTKFEIKGGFLKHYLRALRDRGVPSGIVAGRRILFSETHTQLIAYAQKQQLLHKDIGYVQALCLSKDVFLYDVGLRAISGDIFARGTALSLDEAMARAFGELYERVSMRFLPHIAETVVQSYAQLQQGKEMVFDICALPQSTRAQKQMFHTLVWNEHTPFRWVRATHAATKERAWVPAQLVYWNYERLQGEPYLREIDTGGLGAGYTKEEAVLSATSELVQRHSFFSYWYAKEAPPKIDIESVIAHSAVSKETKQVLSGTRDYGFEIHLLECTQEGGTPSVATILTKQGLGWFVGMSTHESYEYAIQRSTCEALSTYTWTMGGVADAPFSVFEKTTLTEGFCDDTLSSGKRIHAWSHEECAEQGQFFIQGEVRSFESVCAQKIVSAEEALATIAHNGVFVVEAHEPYLEELDFHVVRVIAPHIYTLALSERFSTPLLNGVEPKNTYPHPFP